MYARRPTYIYESACMYTYAYTNMHVYASLYLPYHAKPHHASENL